MMEGDLVGVEKKNNKRERDDVMGRGLEKRMSGVVEEEYSYSGDEMINGVKYEEEKDEMINGGVKHQEEVKEAPAPAPAAANGLFDQLITSLVNSPRSNQEDESEKKVNGDETTEKKINGDEEEDGDDVIDNIVARLPRTLSEDPTAVTEDTTPATDEASILIHSIIHD